MDKIIERPSVTGGESGERRGSNMEHPDFGEICECECHRDGDGMMHSGACCEFCYQPYISEDGVVDIKRFGVLVMEKRSPRKRKRKWKAGQ